MVILSPQICSADALACIEPGSLKASTHPMANQPISTVVTEIRTGKARPLAGSGLISAIDKAVRTGPVAVHTLGLDGDEQADRNFHGGPDKAVLHYAAENYTAWTSDCPEREALFRTGAFGENLVSTEINEANICIGDTFAVGSTVLQVTQPRQPCFKLNHRFQLPSMARRVQETGRTGWYYRVLTPGMITAGDTMTLVDRPHPAWTLRHLQHVLYVDTLNEEALRELIDLPTLSEPLRQILAGRLKATAPESWDARLIGFSAAGTTVGEADRTGWRILKVDAVTQRSPTVKSFRLVDPAGKTLDPYPAGAHVSLELSNGLVRHYSLCGRADAGAYEVAVARSDQSTGGSQYLHDTVKPGDIISVSPVQDRFGLAESARHHLMIAGGIGITPFLSMIEQCRRQGHSFTLHYCLKSAADHPFRDRLDELQPNELVLHYSRTANGERLDIASLLAQQSDTTHVYCCGPDSMMAAVRAATAAWTPERVHFEKFAAELQNGQPFQIRIASTGQLIDVDGHTSILQALRRTGYAVDSSCETGSCGTCCLGLLEGEAEHRDVVLTEDERRTRVAVCVSRARSAVLTLDL